MVIDNVAVHVVEKCLITGLEDLFSPSMVLEMTDDTVRSLAAECGEHVIRRQELNQKLDVLASGLEMCKRYSGRTHPRKYGFNLTEFFDLKVSTHCIDIE